MKNFKRFFSILSVVLLLIAAVPCAQASRVLPPDLQNPDAWYYSDAVFCFNKSLMVGDDHGYFNPMKNVTRGELVTILARIMYGNYEDMSADEFSSLLSSVWAGEPYDPFEAPPVVPDEDLPYFSDADGKWYERGALLLAAEGIVSGIGGGKFDGDRNITRQELAVILQGALSGLGPFGESRSFTDSDSVAGWAKSAVAWAGESGLFSGNEKGEFLPLNNATRAEIAVLVRSFWDMFIS